MFLVVNAGSSSLKVALFGAKGVVVQGHVDWEETKPRLVLQKNNKKLKTYPLSHKGRKAKLIAAFKFLKEEYPRISKIAHRIVHGGDFFNKPVKITPSVKSKINKLKSLAPLHNPVELLCIEITQKIFLKKTQFAHFDTAYYQSMPLHNKVYPLPYSLYNKGIKRYGFHGISHEHVKDRMKKKTGRKKLKLISCHLGNGCSVSASLGDRCLDTSMGFTPLDGVMMGSRPGSLDPGIVIHLIKNERYSLKMLEEMLNHECGLKGIFGTEDMRKILSAKSKSRAKLALELYVDSVAKKIAALITTLGGCDCLVFTGGVGERSPTIRKAIIKRVEALGFRLSQSKNQQKKPNRCISSPISSAQIWVLSALEEQAIYEKCKKMQ